MSLEHASKSRGASRWAVILAVLATCVLLANRVDLRLRPVSLFSPASRNNDHDLLFEELDSEAVPAEKKRSLDNVSRECMSCTHVTQILCATCFV